MMLFTKDHITTHDKKTHWQNQLKILVLVSILKLSIELYTKIDVVLVQCPFKVLRTNNDDDHDRSERVVTNVKVYVIKCVNLPNFVYLQNINVHLL